MPVSLPMQLTIIFKGELIVDFRGHGVILWGAERFWEKQRSVNWLFIEVIEEGNYIGLLS